MSRAIEIEGIERLEGRGITAKVTDSGKQFTTYDTFAKEIGYPDAVESLFVSGNDKGRRLLELIDETFTVLAKGKHDQQHYGYVYVIESAGGERFLVSEHGLDITNPDAPKDIARLDRMEYDELIEYADEVNRAVRRKAYAEGYEQGKFDQRMETSFDAVAKVVNNSGVNNEETQQEMRDRIVERAKDDVSELFLDGHNGVGKVVYSDFGHTTVEFVVDAEKRTVVAILRGAYVGDIFAKGIAKCAPDDCFNAHIGKAIALRRALDLEVPDEYLYAPQPTEARIGDVVQAYYYRGTKPMKPFRVEGFRRNDPQKLIDLENGTWHTYTSFRIDEGDHVIDDTRDTVRKCDTP